MGFVHYLYQTLSVVPLRPSLPSAPILSGSVLSHGSCEPFLLRYPSSYISPVSAFASQLGWQDPFRLWEPTCRLDIDRHGECVHRYLDPCFTDTMRLESAATTCNQGGTGWGLWSGLSVG